MTLANNIVDGHGISNGACHELLPQKSVLCSHSFHSKSYLTSCTLLTRWSAPVLKVDEPCGYKKDLLNLHKPSRISIGNIYPNLYKYLIL